MKGTITMLKINPAIKAIAKEFNLSYEVVNNLVITDKTKNPKRKLTISNLYMLVSDYFNKQAEEIKKEIDNLKCVD